MYLYYYYSVYSKQAIDIEKKDVRKIDDAV